MITLMRHQERAVENARARRRYALYWQPGCGKTIATFAMIADAFRNGWQGRVLILAPKSILKSAWLADAQHFLNIRAIVVWSDNAIKRKKQIDGVWDVAITNYETFKKHAKDFISQGVRWLVVDESSKVKAHDTAITKTCIWFAAQMDHVNLLSGTPAPNSPAEYIPQLCILDPSIFGTNSFYRIANRYFVPVKRLIGGKERILGWNLHPHHKREFLEKLNGVSWALNRDECIDLPGEQDILRPVELSDAESTAYTSAVEQLRVELAAGETAKIRTQAKLMKLRQLASGILYHDNAVRTLGTSKLDALNELLDELGGEQAVIWAEFTAEIQSVCELLDSRGASFGRIDGGTSLDERTTAIESFQAGKLRYLVCHPLAAGHGVTLTAAANDVFFSLSFSYEEHEQARCRIYRKGQTRKVCHYYLLAHGAVDEVILRALRNKKDAADAVLEYLGKGEMVNA